MSNENVDQAEAMNPIQEVPAAEPPTPVVDPSAFLPSSRVIHVSAVQ
jgi:hypothetical protein